ncbi:hypothetical protein ACOZ38_29065 [Sphaerisporangium viridialbum]
MIIAARRYQVRLDNALLGIAQIEAMLAKTLAEGHTPFFLGE